MFASGREDVIPREKQIIAARKVMLTIFSMEQGWSACRPYDMIRLTPNNILSRIF
jgi:hypothetical protein